MDSHILQDSHVICVKCMISMEIDDLKLCLQIIGSKNEPFERYLWKNTDLNQQIAARKKAIWLKIMCLSDFLY